MNVLPDVYICPIRKKECTSFLPKEKLKRTHHITNLQRLLTNINKNGAITKVRILVEPVIM